MKIVTILLCLFVIPSAAQKMDSGRIEYIVKTIDTATLNLTEKDALAAQKYINDLSQGIKDKIVITEFTGMQSLSYEKKNMKLDFDKWSNFQSSLLDAQGLFFYNNDTKELLNQVETLGDRFIIEKKNTTLKWTLLKDKRKWVNILVLKLFVRIQPDQLIRISSKNILLGTHQKYLLRLAR